MIVLKVDDVLRAAKAAREAGTLAAFHPDFQKLGREPYDCQYRYRDNPGVACAVGAGMSDEDAMGLSECQLGETVDNLIAAGTLKVEGCGRTLQRLQNRHDAILNARSTGDSTLAENSSVAFDRFLDGHLAKIAA